MKTVRPNHLDPLSERWRCQDEDQDCADVVEHGSPTQCWLKDPGRGWCPYICGEPPKPYRRLRRRK